MTNTQFPLCTAAGLLVVIVRERFDGAMGEYEAIPAKQVESLLASAPVVSVAQLVNDRDWVTPNLREPTHTARLLLIQEIKRDTAESASTRIIEERDALKEKLQATEAEVNRLTALDYSKEDECRKDEASVLRKQNAELLKENSKLKAQNSVLKDNSLRTYDGLAQKADLADEAMAWAERLARDWAQSLELFTPDPGEELSEFGEGAKATIEQMRDHVAALTEFEQWRKSGGKERE